MDQEGYNNRHSYAWQGCCVTQVPWHQNQQKASASRTSWHTQDHSHTGKNTGSVNLTIPGITASHKRALIPNTAYNCLNPSGPCVYLAITKYLCVSAGHSQFLTVLKAVLQQSWQGLCSQKYAIWWYFFIIILNVIYNRAQMRRL